MTPGLQPYPTYKPSGVQWLGAIPAHWEVKRLKHVSTVNDEALAESADPGLELTYVDIGSVDHAHGITSTETFTFESAPSRARRIVRHGDVIVSTVRTYLRAITPIVCPVANLIVSTGFAVIRPVQLTGGFAAYALKAPYCVERVVANSVGIAYPAITPRELVNLPITYAPLAEQAAIVRYLDHADDRIRRYISAKEQLIALLEEQKQAIINQAVTRGLDPHVSLKPSGVGWLGDIPAQWEIRRSKRLFSPRRELARPNDIQLSATQAYGVIPQDEYEQRVDRRIVKISLHLDKRRHVEVDDFVISMRSFQGGLERAWATGCIRSSYIILRPTIEADVEFFSYLFKSRAYIRALQSTANFIRDGQDLNFKNFCEVDLPIPPSGEQREIALALGEATANIDTAITRTRRQIELLREYRTRLIADVVTGKLDVRAAAEGVPEEGSSRDGAADQPGRRRRPAGTVERTASCRESIAALDCERQHARLDG